MALETPLWLQALTGDPAISYTGQQMRQLVESIFTLPGVTMAGDLAVSQRAAGANMSVDVAAGQAAIRGTSIARQGSYVVTSTAIENVVIGAAHATLPRIDLVVAQVFDRQADGGTRYAWQPIVVAGTPLSTPVAPAAPASSIRLAEVRVNAAVPSIVAADITDRRQLNCRGDVPLWQMRGGNATAVPAGVSTFLGTYWDAIGVDHKTSTGVITIRTPGRYLITHNTRLKGGATNFRRHCYTEHTRVSVPAGAGGLNPVRLGSAMQHPATLDPNGLPLSSSGMGRCGVGDTLSAKLSHDTTGVTLFDEQGELLFSGVWVGP